MVLFFLSTPTSPHGFQTAQDVQWMEGRMKLGAMLPESSLASEKPSPNQAWQCESQSALSILRFESSHKNQYSTNCSLMENNQIIELRPGQQGKRDWMTEMHVIWRETKEQGTARQSELDRAERGNALLALRKGFLAWKMKAFAGVQRWRGQRLSRENALPYWHTYCVNIFSTQLSPTT